VGAAVGGAGGGESVPDGALDPTGTWYGPLDAGGTGGVDVLVSSMRTASPLAGLAGVAAACAMAAQIPAVPAMAIAATPLVANDNRRSARSRWWIGG
jgi:hypothetical protein